MITKNDVYNIVEQEVLPKIDELEKISSLEKKLESPDNLEIEITKSGWKSPNEVKLLRLDIRESGDPNKQYTWYISYAITTKGKKHLAGRRLFYASAPKLLEYELIPECFTIENSQIEHTITKKSGQSVANIIGESRLSENDIACAVARLFGASKESIDVILEKYSNIAYTSNSKTLADTLLTNEKENENQLRDSLIGLVDEAKNAYLKYAENLMSEKFIENKNLQDEINHALSTGEQLKKEIMDANINPYAPTIIVPMDLAPENITIDMRNSKAYIIDQTLSPERQTIRGSPISIIRTYERIIQEHAFKHKDVFGKILQILKAHYYDAEASTWAEYAPLVKKVTDFYHDARSTRRKIQEEILKPAPAPAPAPEPVPATNINQMNITEYK